jgi:hypothetical protein
VPAFGDKYVGRLNVAMDNPFGVRSVKGISNLDAEFEHLV